MVINYNEKRIFIEIYRICIMKLMNEKNKKNKNGSMYLVQRSTAIIKKGKIKKKHKTCMQISNKVIVF